MLNTYYRECAPVLSHFHVRFVSSFSPNQSHYEKTVRGEGGSIAKLITRVAARLSSLYSFIYHPEGSEVHRESVLY